MVPASHDGWTPQQLAAVRQREPQPGRDREPPHDRGRSTATTTAPSRLVRSSSCGPSTISASSGAPLVASLAWNHYRHLEAYFGVPCSGRVLHTLNARLSVDELAYIIDHAQDRVLLVDADLLPIVEQLAGRIPSVKTVIVLDHQLPSGFDVDGEVLRLRGAALGRTDGVRAARHRRARADGPLLHVGHDRAAEGRRVHPPVDLPPRARRDLGRRPRHRAGRRGAAAGADVPRQRVGRAPCGHGRRRQAGASSPAPSTPGAWVDLVVARAGHHRRRRARRCGWPWPTSSPRCGVTSLPDVRHLVCGGGQPPRALIARFRDEFGVDLIQAWGMTETSPIASLAWPQERMRDWSADEVLDRGPYPGRAARFRAWS